MASDLDATRAAIRRGQRLLRAGERRQAVDVWHAALTNAYACEDYAGMFVLTKNLGEVSLALAQSAVGADGATTVSRLQDAAGYFKYALGLVDQCGVRDRVGAYSALEASVAHVEGGLAEAEVLLLRAAEAQDEEAAAVVATTATADITSTSHSIGVNGNDRGCTTCGRVPIEAELVLDESDGCYYCTECYEAYYAGLKAVEVPVVEDPVACNEPKSSNDAASEGSVDTPGMDEDGSSSITVDNFVQQSAEIPSMEREELAPIDDPLSPHCDAAVTHSHVSRIELGSLADVLGQAVTLEKSTVIGNASAQEDAEHDDQVSSEEVTERDPTYSTDTEAKTLNSTPARYTVQELLGLRRFVSADACPLGLELSPVHKSNARSPRSVKDSARNAKSSSGLKKPGPGLLTKPKQTAEPESHRLLPTLELIESLRSADQTNLSGLDAVRELTSTLFNVPQRQQQQQQQEQQQQQ